MGITEMIIFGLFFKEVDMMNGLIDSFYLANGHL
jgi:hypothetical protein